jgi:hypothetical protein
MSQDLLSRIPQWENEAEVFERKAHALRQLIESVRVLNGDAERLFALHEASPVPAVGRNQYPTSQGPRGREAVRAIVAARPGSWLVRDIKRVNSANGWPSDDAGIETAVIRMAKKGECVKIPGRRGLYKFGPLADSGGREAASEPNLHRKEDKAA